MIQEKNKISIQIVTWNSLKFLPYCLESIFNQSYKNFSVLIIDNASSDGTINFLEKNYLKTSKLPIRIIKNSKNLGYSIAHNQGFKFISADYYLILNPDIILEPDFLEILISRFQKERRIGALAPKILRMHFGNLELGEVIKTKVVDSLGLEISKFRSFRNRGEGEIDNKKFLKSEYVFGFTGACALLSAKALEDIKIVINNYSEYFDQDFFAYKEDIDLSWRMQLRGWKILFVPEAKCYHFRQAKKSSFKKQKKMRRQKSELVNFLSYRNHFYVLIKNELGKNFLKDSLFIFFYELIKFFYLLIFERKTLLALFDVFKNFKKMVEKRKYIMKNRKVGAEEIRKFIS